MDNLLWVPIGMAAILGLAGLSGGWRRLIVGLIIGYSAIVLASQHYKLVANFATLQGYLRFFQPQQRISIAFSLTVAIAIFAVYICYIFMWRPNSPQKGRGDFWSLLRGISLAAVGWVLGVFLIVGLPSNLFGRNTSSTPANEWLWNATRQTTSVVWPLVQPWLIEPIPRFLLVG